MMIDFEDEGGGSNLLDTLRRLLPVLMVAMLLSGNLMFAVVNIVPGWQLFEAVNGDVQAARAHIAEIESAPVSDETAVLQAQVASVQEDRAAAATGFLSKTEADAMMEQMYTYADSGGVQITAMRAADPPDNADPTILPRSLRLQVEGDTSGALMRFVNTIREASVPGIAIGEVLVESDKDGSTLLMNVTLHTSSYAPGTLLANLPEGIAPDPNALADVASDIEAGEPVDVTVLDPAADPAAPTPDPAAVAALEPTATYPPAPVSLECPGAPPTLFTLGDMAVVDFDTDTSLRILGQPRLDDESVAVLIHARDGDMLRLVGGPICGEWMGMPIWYWYVEYGDFFGWAGEASDRARYMCPVDNPECA
ncbi:MAG: hypothetical protein ACOCXZ_00810 [Chloroflexota bacterium]